MQLYCLEDFKEAVEKLSKSKAHAALEKSIIEYFCDKQLADVRIGVNLNQSDTAPYIKKRLEGAGGFRVYFLILIVKDCLYLMYVHPKTGPGGSENITDEAMKAFYKKVIACIMADEGLYTVSPDEKRKKLVFARKMKEVSAV